MKIAYKQKYASFVYFVFCESRISVKFPAISLVVSPIGTCRLTVAVEVIGLSD